jgi:hypothetical protein
MRSILVLQKWRRRALVLLLLGFHGSRRWHIRDETYSKALAEIVNFQHRLPLAERWGEGTTSSSDGQRFFLVRMIH